MRAPWFEWADAMKERYGEGPDYLSEYHGLCRRSDAILAEKGFPVGEHSLVALGYLPSISVEARGCGLDLADMLYRHVRPRQDNPDLLRTAAEFMGVQPDELVSAFKRLEEALGDEYKAIDVRLATESAVSPLKA
ncbi:MAG: hypothetical protein HY369_04450 [Candidatus Aenigmarchaeota archaeon]|nr:hypothetical protein [Candidatus Aenigmarchaeota archaeon]